MKKDDIKVNYSRYKRFVVNNIVYYGQKPGIKAYLEILLSLTAVIIFAVFALRPTLIAIAGLLKEIQSRKEIVAILDEKKANLDKAGQIYNQEQEKIKLVNQAIPNAPSPDDSARQIEGVFQESNANLTRLGIGQATLLGENTEISFNINSQPIPNTGQLTVNFEAAGNYENLRSLASNIENLRKVLYVDGAEIFREGEGSSGQILVSISGKFPFYLIQKNEL